MDINSVKLPRPDASLPVQTPPPPPTHEEAAQAGLAAIPAGPVPCVTAMLYVQGISPSDISQGSIGDCSFQATLASLARTPEGQAVIHKCIEERKDASGAPVYRVSIFTKAPSGFVPFKVDITFANLPAGGLRVGVDPRTNAHEVWPRVLEAAMLRANHGVTCCTVPDAFGILTGGTAIDTSTSDRTFEDRLVMGFATKKVQVLSTTGAFTGELQNPKLKPDHAYTVVGVIHMSTGTFVTVRNPWGYDDPASLPIDQVKKYFPTYSEAALP